MFLKTSVCGGAINGRQFMLGQRLSTYRRVKPTHTLTWSPSQSHKHPARPMFKHLQQSSHRHAVSCRRPVSGGSGGRGDRQAAPRSGPAGPDGPGPEHPALHSPRVTSSGAAAGKEPRTAFPRPTLLSRHEAASDCATSRAAARQAFLPFTLLIAFPFLLETKTPAFRLLMTSCSKRIF